MIRSLLVLFLCATSAGQSAISAGRGVVANPNMAAFPAPPPSASFFNNLQAQPTSAWSSAGGTICCGGSNTGSVGVTFGNATPSLSGSSIHLLSSGNQYNVQTFTPQGCGRLPGGSCTGFSNVQADAYILIPSYSDPIQSYEGPNVSIYTGTYLYYPSIQCGTNTGSTTPNVPTWNIWNNNANWTTLNISCAAFVTNKDIYQHVQVKYNINFAGNVMTYPMISIQNQIICAPCGGTYPGYGFTGGGNFKPQFQVGARNIATATGYFFDEYSVAAW